MILGSMKLIVVAAVVSIGFAASSYAQNKNAADLTENTTGAELYEICKISDENCDSAALTIATAVFLYASSRGDKSYCPPEKMGAIQARLVVMKYLQEHPEKLHEPAFNLVAVAMIRAFPCSK